MGVPLFTSFDIHPAHTAGLPAWTRVGGRDAELLMVVLCIRMYICTYVCTYIHTYTHTHTHTHTHIYIYIHIYIYTHIYTHIYIYIRRYVHTYTYIYIIYTYISWARVGGTKVSSLPDTNTPYPAYTAGLPAWAKVGGRDAELLKVVSHVRARLARGHTPHSSAQTALLLSGGPGSGKTALVHAAASVLSRGAVLAIPPPKKKSTKVLTEPHTETPDTGGSTPQNRGENENENANALAERDVALAPVLGTPPPKTRQNRNKDASAPAGTDTALAPVMGGPRPETKTNLKENASAPAGTDTALAPVWCALLSANSIGAVQPSQALARVREVLALCLAKAPALLIFEVRDYRSRSIYLDR